MKNVAIILSDSQIDYAIVYLTKCKELNAKSAVIFSTMDKIDSNEVKSVADLPNPDWFQHAHLTIVGLPVDVSDMSSLFNPKKKH